MMTAWKVPETITMSDNTIIACRGVWKIFGPNPRKILETGDRSLSRKEIKAKTNHVVAVREVSFEIGKGECFVVMGLSGSGKSTLARCLSRLIEPSCGEILIDSADVTRMTRNELLELRRNRLTMVFQHFGLFPHRRVVDNVSYGLEVRGMPKAERTERAMEMIELVGLEGWDQCYPRELSGGMQQRVGLARAMAVDPEILVFDEPFSALDPLIRREMQDELIELQRRLKKTMVFITHDFLEAIKLGDRIAIMNEGEFSQVGTPEDIVASPADDYVREFAEDVPKYKVLTAGRVLRPVTRRNLLDPGLAVLDSTKIEDLIDHVACHDRPVGVKSASGEIIGEIDRTIVMRSMASGA